MYPPTALPTRKIPMLERMAGIPDGIRDALTYHTTPLNGTYYFVPAIEAIEQYSSGQDEPD